jgi:ribosomal protein L23
MRPRITEKATIASTMSVYVFDIAAKTTKSQVAQAIERFYKVKPRKVAIVNTKPTATRNMRSGKKGMTDGSRKAYIYLKKGETITIV